jgi:ribonuclease BN (tRNA processing enzyme)
MSHAVKSEAGIGWGHSTSQEGVRLAQAMAEENFAIFHHDPKRTDAALLEIDLDAQALFKGAFAARDFQTVE